MSSLEYALYLLKMRDRSEGEIRQKMKRKEFSPEEIEKTVAWLLDKKFLDDQKFVANYIRNKQEFGSAGKYKLRAKLRTLFVDSKLVDEELSKIENDDECERAMGLALNWLNKKQNVPPEAETSSGFSLERRRTYEKLGRFLAARGYEIGIIKSILERVLKG